MMKLFLFATSVSTQPPIQWVMNLLPRELSGRDVKLTTHLHLVPRLKTYVFIAWF